MHSPTANLVTIQSQHIDEVWPSIEPYVAAACEYGHGRYTPESYKESLEKADMQLWMAVDGDKILAVAGTSILNYPGVKVCRIEFCGGSHLGLWKNYISAIENWAVSLGCTLVEMCGRKGWGRVHKDYEQTLFLQKELV